MGFRLGGKQHKNPSGLHNKVNYLLVEGRKDWEEVNRIYNRITSALLKRQKEDIHKYLKSPMLKRKQKEFDIAWNSWYIAYQVACSVLGGYKLLYCKGFDLQKCFWYRQLFNHYQQGSKKDFIEFNKEKRKYE